MTSKKTPHPDDHQEIEIKDITDGEDVNKSRRNLFKIGAGIAATAATGASGAFIADRIDGVEHDSFPVPLDPAVLKPFPQRDSIGTFCFSPQLAQQFPARNQNFENGWNFQHGAMEMARSLVDIRHATELAEKRGQKLGMSQLDNALSWGGWAPVNAMAPMAPNMLPDHGVNSWHQGPVDTPIGRVDQVAPERWEFASGEEAAMAIKSAARLYGAVRCGITPNDPHWNFDPLYDVQKGKEISWDEFPFKPKSVIVFLVDMDYAAMATAPSKVSSATVGNGYSKMSFVGHSIKNFLHALGYKAVSASNDLGNSVAYAISAGLGEGARNGTLVAPRLGPRVRIAKVYTDLELPAEAYDKPRSFGIMDFCTKCKLCADACPSKAICSDDEPTWGPTYENGDNPDYAWHHQRGVKKFYSDAKKCFKYWIDSDTDCGACITACPWNKPDFWHHRMIDASNAFTGGPIHTFMKVMDEVYGYGNTFDEKAVVNFWKTGKDIEI
ncbi:reductive dehalogenase [Photobacterium sagamiensis]|uniref:reductive dehalogenase n=1 Tax=Photobacterium sagamiensis TaxID=2910241 RepID=UPI003D0982D1